LHLLFENNLTHIVFQRLFTGVGTGNCQPTVICWLWKTIILNGQYDMNCFSRGFAGTSTMGDFDEDFLIETSPANVPAF